MKYSDQVILLNDCLRQGIELEVLLKIRGLTYDDLVYKQNPEFPRQFYKSITLDDVMQKNNGIPVVSFFSGAGGLDLGFEAAGFYHLASIDNNQLFCQTLRYNRPHWRVIGPPDHTGDIHANLEITEILKRDIGLHPYFEGVFHGGPPCQPFSIAANQRFAKWGSNFKRIGYSHETKGNLLFDYIAQIVYFKPLAFLIENVPGLLTIDNGEQLSIAYEILKSNGYTINEPTIINSKYFGIPQSRERVIILGSRMQNRTYDFPSRHMSELPCFPIFETPIDNIPNHVTRKHKAESILRYMELNFGERDHLGRVDRLDPRLPAKTVIAGGTGGGGRSHLHPYFPRTLSPRESARLQTFPDKYFFCGPPARQLTQIGNAVPPLLSFQLAWAMFESLFE